MGDQVNLVVDLELHGGFLKRVWAGVLAVDVEGEERASVPSC